MRVLTLNNTDFLEACRRLEKKCRDFNPDLVVGVASGGAIVAQNIFRNVKHITVTARRPSTSKKDRLSFILKVVRKLPEPFRNGMRIAESRLLSLKKNEPAVLDSIDTGQARRILVVDDAVDSGATLAGVINALRTSPDAAVCSAAITMTTPSPLVRPDFTIYNNRTLIRFPWSKDNPTTI